MVFKSRAQVTRVFLSVLISAQISLEPLISHAATGNLMPRSNVALDKGYQEIDPIWQQFADAKDANFQLSFSTSDPALDQDPFFMRSQAWVKAASASSELGYTKNPEGVQISIPNTPRSLQLSLPLTPFHASDEFIFLSADANSDIFEKAAGKSEVAGEGVFFINRADLAVQALDGKPVPVYFFPLAGQGWKGDLSALEMPQADMIVVGNKTESVALELKDLETVMKAQQINMMMAAGLSAKNRPGSKETSQIAPGMTAAFGLFFTGIDLKMPEKSMWRPDQTASFMMKHPVMAAALKKFTRMMPFAGVPKANAFELSPEVIERLVYVGSILTGMLAASVVLKYSQPGVRKKIADLRGGKTITAKTKLGRAMKIAGREVKETFDVFAGVTTTVQQFASVTFANSLELFLDRWVPAAAADHTLVRRILNNSYYRSRNSVKGVPVNAKTFYLGAVVLGSVDTAMVVVQYTVAVPMIAHSVSPYLPESTQARIEYTFDPNNPNTAKVVVNDSVRNGLSHTTGGASDYSLNSRQQIIDPVTKEVENSMRARGLDPIKPQYQALKQSEIEAKIDIAMKQRGLPGSDQFLFDATSTFQNIPKTLGYKAAEDMAAKESFILANRFGLTKNALDKAIEVAKQWQTVDGSQASQEVVEILEETVRSMSFLKNGLKNGAEGIEAARKARQQLTLLSYEGSIEYAVRYIPESWSAKYSAEAAQSASLLFRQALYSYLSKEGDGLLMAKDKELAEFGDKAKQNVKAAMKTAHADLAAMSDPAVDASLKTKYSYEYKLRLQIEINDLARAQDVAKKADAYKPPKTDWLARRQHRRAEQEAQDKLDRYLKSLGGQEVSDAQILKWKQAYYKDSLAKQIGLHLESKDVAAAQGREDYVKMIEFVENIAEETTESEMKKNANLARYLEKASEAERAKIQMSLYANNYFSAYKEATTDLEMVKPTDPAQPGRFQRIRQNETVRNSKVLTHTLRTLESWGDDQAGLKPGVSGFLARRFMYQDLWSSHHRLMKVFFPAITIGYAWSYYFWQVHMPYSSLVMLVLTSASTMEAPSQWLNRAFRMNGLKAMGGVMSKIGYALPFAWVTFLGMFPVMMYSPDLAVFFSDYVRDPIMGVFGQVKLETWLKAAGVAGLISLGVKDLMKNDFADKASKLKKLVNADGTGAVISCRKVLIH